MKIKCRLNHNSGVSAPVVMGHVGRKHNGELHQSGYFSVTAPGGLVDYLFESVFRYGVSVGVARGEHMAYQLLRARRMILHQVMPDDVAVAGERLARPLVHIEDAAVGVANSHGTLNLVGPAAQGLVGVEFHGSESVWGGIKKKPALSGESAGQNFCFLSC